MTKAAEELRVKGNAAYANQDYGNAVIFYTQALNLEESSVLFANRSAAYANLQDGISALNDAEHSLRLDPAYPKAYGRKAVALSILKDWPGIFSVQKELESIDATKKSPSWQLLGRIVEDARKQLVKRVLNGCWVGNASEEMDCYEQIYGFREDNTAFLRLFGTTMEATYALNVPSILNKDRFLEIDLNVSDTNSGGEPVRFIALLTYECVEDDEIRTFYGLPTTETPKKWYLEMTSLFIGTTRPIEMKGPEYAKFTKVEDISPYLNSQMDEELTGCSLGAQVMTLLQSLGSVGVSRIEELKDTDSQECVKEKMIQFLKTKSKIYDVCKRHQVGVVMLCELMLIRSLEGRLDDEEFKGYFSSMESNTLKMLKAVAEKQSQELQSALATVSNFVFDRGLTVVLLCPKRYLDNPGSWVGSWVTAHLKSQRLKNKDQINKESNLIRSRPDPDVKPIIDWWQEAVTWANQHQNWLRPVVVFGATAAVGSIAIFSFRRRKVL